MCIGLYKVLSITITMSAVQFKLQRIMGICFKLRYKLPDWCLRNIYFAFVHPYYLYGFVDVYGNTFVSDGCFTEKAI